MVREWCTIYKILSLEVGTLSVPHKFLFLLSAFTVALENTEFQILMSHFIKGNHTQCSEYQKVSIAEVCNQLISIDIAPMIKLIEYILYITYANLIIYIMFYHRSNEYIYISQHTENLQRAIECYSTFFC